MNLNLISLLMAAFIFRVGIYPLKINRMMKFLLSIFTFAISIKLYLFSLFCDHPKFAPKDMIPWLYNVFCALWGTLFFLSSFLFLYFIVSFIIKQLNKKHNRITPVIFTKMTQKIFLILTFTALITAGIGTYCGTADPEIRYVRIPVKNIPEKNVGMRIAIISDLHVCQLTPPDYVQKIVNKVNAEKPDIILILGDNGDGMPNDLKKQLEPIKNLHSRYGVYGVQGNHEYYYGFYSWEILMQSLGVQILNNKSVCVPGFSDFHIAGTADPIILKIIDDDDVVSGDLPDIKKAFKNIPKDSFTIFLSHTPQDIQKISEGGASVIFSGHTHGGMFPGPHWILLLFKYRHICGLHHMYNSQLYITRGAGNHHALPFRLFAPKEITIATLCAES